MAATITREELKNKLDRREKVTLVEALAPEYFARGHLPGALNIPMDQVKQLAPKLLPNKDAQVVTYCMNKL
jgi:rhodanese-related sulfurtransferase